MHGKKIETKLHSKALLAYKANNEVEFMVYGAIVSVGIAGLLCVSPHSTCDDTAVNTLKSYYF